MHPGGSQTEAHGQSALFLHSLPPTPQMGKPARNLAALPGYILRVVYPQASPAASEDLTGMQEDLKPSDQSFGVRCEGRESVPQVSHQDRPGLS